jgi:hypothetical protein
VVGWSFGEDVRPGEMRFGEDRVLKHVFIFNFSITAVDSFFSHMSAIHEPKWRCQFLFPMERIWTPIFIYVYLAILSDTSA